jgi:hypothetical protein
MGGSTRVEVCSFFIIFGVFYLFLWFFLKNQFNSLKPSPVVAGVARVHACQDSTRHARQAEPAPPLACWHMLGSLVFFFFKQMAVR